MTKSDFSGSAEITDEGIKKHFQSFEPIRAIYELVWNGLDAGATKVDISIEYNELCGVDSITVFDNGDGIDINNLNDNFKKFNESTKRNDDNKHGAHGKGRLAFHKLCEQAVWYTRRDDYNARIKIISSAIKDFEGKFINNEKQHALLSGIKSGTCVELMGFSKATSLPSEKSVFKSLSLQFGWFLAFNKSHHILLNGKSIKVPEHELHETKFFIDDIEFLVKMIRWEYKPGKEKSYNYLINRSNRIVSKILSRFNNKIGFHASAYVFSSWNEKFDPDGFELGSDSENKSSPIYKKLNKILYKFQQEIYYDFLRRYVDNEIEKFEERGYFPIYAEPQNTYFKWREKNTKAVVKEIYFADPSIFNKLKAKQAKILINLIDKILVSNKNDDLFDILDGVLDLDNENMSLLAKQLKKTTLDNIIGTIEVLQNRQTTIHKLKEIMENRFATVLETPDLQKIIENNTWLFGAKYETLGAEEDTFHNIAKKLRNQINDIDVISEDDVSEGATVEGINRQVDLFLSRKTPQFDSTGKKFFNCLIIEIKRPGISLNKKHLQQLDDYAEIIEKHDAFNSAHMRFELILIGRKISKDDIRIKQRIESLKDKGENGLITDGRIKCYVKNWFTIFDEFDLTNGYLLENLKTKLDSLEDTSTKNLIEDLQAKSA